MSLLSKTGGKSGDYIRQSHPPSLDPGCDKSADLVAAADLFGSSTLPRSARYANSSTSGNGRVAAVTAAARVCMPLLTWRKVVDNASSKGDVLEVARMAGLMAGCELTSALAPASMLLGHSFVWRGHSADNEVWRPLRKRGYRSATGP